MDPALNLDITNVLLFTVISLFRISVKLGEIVEKWRRQFCVHIIWEFFVGILLLQSAINVV